MAGLFSKMSSFFASLSTELEAVTALGVASPLIYFALPSSPNSTLSQMVNLSALSFQYGMHLWVSSVAGTTMFFHLPRHVFGRLQSQLFPRYFLISSLTSLTALGSFALMFSPSTWEGDTKVKGLLLSVGLVGNLLNTLYFGPASTKAMWTCQAFEKRVNHGHEVGVMKFDMSGLEKHQLEKYNLVRRRFGVLHGFSMMLNFGVIAAHTAYFYYVAKDLASASSSSVVASLNN